eukprot:TRINITY_DN9188_c0_g2_i1.p1 TRINITY_DN9188_c0_g2~~TRINITY_DN9188_c0_g2_i1.p1  ORF type:complete len:131 (-),score=18.06 TRINITY_DN9188_c0_g2_i1:172-564(-)
MMIQTPCLIRVNTRINKPLVAASLVAQRQSDGVIDTCHESWDSLPDAKVLWCRRPSKRYALPAEACFLRFCSHGGCQGTVQRCCQARLQPQGCAYAVTTSFITKKVSKAKQTMRNRNTSCVPVPPLRPCF